MRFKKVIGVHHLQAKPLVSRDGAKGIEGNFFGSSHALAPTAVVDKASHIPSNKWDDFCITGGVALMIHASGPPRNQTYLLSIL